MAMNPPPEQTGELSQNDRLLAACCYWGIFIFFFVPPLVILLTYQDKSSFVKKHAYQGLAMCVLSVVMMFSFSFLAIITLGLFAKILPLVSLALVVYLIVLGVWIMQGKDPEIPVLSDLLKKNIPGGI